MTAAAQEIRFNETDLNYAVSQFIHQSHAPASMHSVVSAIHKLCEITESALKSGIPKEQLKAILLPAYDLHGRSGFVSRLQNWPRGYPGDFETIEWIANPVPQGDTHNPAYWIEWYALNGAIAQQHRNKLAWQRQLVLSASLHGGRGLNVGCGGCADLADSPAFIANCDFTLLDMDDDALALAAKRLGNARSVQVVKRDVVRGVRHALTHGPFDLVLCGGLFDYLPDALISRLLRQLSGSLTSGGAIAFTNISDQNPFRVWMENLANWSLIHRSEDQIADIVHDAGIDTALLSIKRDASGLTLLCSLQS